MGHSTPTRINRSQTPPSLRCPTATTRFKRDAQGERPSLGQKVRYCKDASAVVSAGGVATLVDLLSHPSAQTKAAEALFRLAYDSSAACGALLACDAIVPLITVVGKAPSIAAQARACDVLAILATHESNVRDRVIAAGAISPVIALLGPARSQAHAARALTALVASNRADTAGTLAASDAIVAGGAVAPLTAMLASANIEAPGCAAHALYHLARVRGDDENEDADDLRTTFLSAGGVAPLVERLKMVNPIECAATMNELVRWGPRARAALVASGGAAILADLIHRTGVTTAAVEHAWQALRILAASKDASLIAAPMLVKMMRRASSATDKAYAAWSIYNIVCRSDAAARESFRAAGAMDALMEMLASLNVPLPARQSAKLALLALCKI